MTTTAHSKMKECKEEVRMDWDNSCAAYGMGGMMCVGVDETRRLTKKVFLIWWVA